MNFQPYLEEVLLKIESLTNAHPIYRGIMQIFIMKPSP